MCQKNFFCFISKVFLIYCEVIFNDMMKQLYRKWLFSVLFTIPFLFFWLITITNTKSKEIMLKNRRKNYILVTLLNVTEFRKMSKNFTECHGMSQNVTKCHKMSQKSQNVTQCNIMSQNSIDSRVFRYYPELRNDYF